MASTPHLDRFALMSCLAGSAGKMTHACMRGKTLYSNTAMLPLAVTGSSTWSARVHRAANTSCYRSTRQTTLIHRCTGAPACASPKPRHSLHAEQQRHVTPLALCAIGSSWDRYSLHRGQTQDWPSGPDSRPVQPALTGRAHDSDAFPNVVCLNAITLPPARDRGTDLSERWV